MDRESGIKNVLVIFGGCSPEYGVSLQSAAAVIRNIDRDKYMPVLVGITKAGDWYYYDGDVQNIENDSWWNGYMQDLGEHEEEYVPDFKNSLT